MQMLLTCYLSVLDRGTPAKSHPDALAWARDELVEEVWTMGLDLKVLSLFLSRSSEYLLEVTGE